MIHALGCTAGAAGLLRTCPHPRTHLELLPLPYCSLRHSEVPGGHQVHHQPGEHIRTDSHVLGPALGWNAGVAYSMRCACCA